MNNNRYQCLRFSVDCNSVLHGFAGYFETTLYKDVTLSKHGFHKGSQVLPGEGLNTDDYVLSVCCVCVLGIKPDTHSPGMFSWFPILFPLKVSCIVLHL